MNSEWQLQEAKGNFSQLIKRAANGDAQGVTVRGKPTAVVVSAEEYAWLTRRRGKLSAALLRTDLAVGDQDFPRKSLTLGRCKFSLAKLSSGTGIWIGRQFYFTVHLARPRVSIIAPLS